MVQASALNAICGLKTMKIKSKKKVRKWRGWVMLGVDKFPVTFHKIRPVLFWDDYRRCEIIIEGE